MEVHFDSQTHLYSVDAYYTDTFQWMNHPIKNIRVISANDKDMEIDISGHRIKVTIVRDQETVYVFSSVCSIIYSFELNPQGNKYVFKVPEESYLKLETLADSQSTIKTPMPCKIAQVLVKSGDIVQVGQVLVVLEAMKMEHVIRSSQAGTIKEVFYKESDIVGQNKILLTFVDEEKKII